MISVLLNGFVYASDPVYNKINILLVTIARLLMLTVLH